MAPRAFFSEVAPWAADAAERTGVPASVILAQWAVETGYGTSKAWVEGNNFAGVSPGGRLAYYPSRTAGFAAYVNTLLNPRYAAVRGAGDPVEAARALGESPWAESRYGGAGAQLLEVMSANDLARFDAGGATPVDLTVPGTGLRIPLPDVVGGIRQWVVKGAALAAAAGLVIAGAVRLGAPAGRAAARAARGPAGVLA